MKKISTSDRLLLLMTVLLASYQIVEGINDAGTFAITAYTVAFGVLLVASLLLIILGFDVLETSIVVIVSTIIPLSLSLGLVADFFLAWGIPYLIFVVIGFIAIITTRIKASQKVALMPLALWHGVSGIVIFVLPIYVSLTGMTSSAFVWVGFGGALIGILGLMLTFLRSGNPVLSKETTLTAFPAILFLMTLAFVVGFKF
jgi:hypothetical protein